MIARVARHVLLRTVALAATVALALLADGGVVRAATLDGPGVCVARSLLHHVGRGVFPPALCEREAAEGRQTASAPGGESDCPPAAALPLRPARLASSAAAPPAVAIILHRARAGSESCCGTSLPPPRA